MPIRLIWRLRRKQQITKRYFTSEAKRMKVAYTGATGNAPSRNIKVAKK